MRDKGGDRVESHVKCLVFLVKEFLFYSEGHGGLRSRGVTRKDRSGFFCDNSLYADKARIREAMQEAAAVL